MPNIGTWYEDDGYQDRDDIPTLEVADEDYGDVGPWDIEQDEPTAWQDEYDNYIYGEDNQ